MFVYAVSNDTASHDNSTNSVSVPLLGGIGTMNVLVRKFHCIPIPLVLRQVGLDKPQVTSPMECGRFTVAPLSADIGFVYC